MDKRESQRCILVSFQRVPLSKQVSEVCLSCHFSPFWSLLATRSFSLSRYRSEGLQNIWQDNCVTTANHLCPAGPPVVPVKFWDNSFLLKALCYCVGLQYCSSCACAMRCPTRAGYLRG